jgi:hypothetical protein
VAELVKVESLLREKASQICHSRPLCGHRKTPDNSEGFSSVFNPKMGNSGTLVWNWRIPPGSRPFSSICDKVPGLPDLDDLGPTGESSTEECPSFVESLSGGDAATPDADG